LGTATVYVTKARLVRQPKPSSPSPSPAGHGSPDDVAGEVADEFGGAPGAIDEELHTTRS
jgi:hypothetical protein